MTVSEVWDYVAGVFRRLRGDTDGRAVTLPEGQYLATPPTLVDEEYHHLTLTQDAKLRVDDPTTQATVQDIEDKLDDPTTGLAAIEGEVAAIPTTPELEADAATRYNTLGGTILTRAAVEALTTHDTDVKALIAAAQADLDNPGQYKADVSALALEATLTAIKGAGWTTETLKAIKDAIATAQADLDNPAQYKADVSALALAVVCTEARLARLDADVSSRLAAASYTPERGTDSAMLAANGALEATLTAVKGAGWATETLVAIKAAIDAISGGATAQQVWEYATRKLTDYHVSSGSTVNLLAAAATLAPTAGYRWYWCWDIYEDSLFLSGYDTSWRNMAAATFQVSFVGYQKVSSGAGATRFNNADSVSHRHIYAWESVGASPVQPYVPTPGEVVLEETPDWIIAVPEKWLREHRAEIETDSEDRLGYDRHRDVLTKMGFKMPRKEVTESVESNG